MKLICDARVRTMDVLDIKFISFGIFICRWYFGVSILSK